MVCDKLRVDIIKGQEALKISEIRAEAAETTARNNGSDHSQALAALQLERDAHARQMDV